MNNVRLALLGLLLLLAAVAGWRIGISSSAVTSPNDQRILQTTTTVLKQVQALSEYVTVKYVLEKVIIYEDVKWYGDNRVLLVAQGIVKAGLDFSLMSPDDIHLSGRHIQLRLPPPTITEAYLNEHHTRVIERSTGMLRQFDKGLEQEARIRALEEIQRSARFNGILDQAAQNARRQLSALLVGLGYSVEFLEGPGAASTP